jgi:hypothetical protein
MIGFRSQIVKDRVAEWLELWQSYHVDRKVPQVTVHAPVGMRVFNGFEAHTNLSKFPMRKTAKIELGGTEAIELDAKPQLYLVGPGFTAAMPLVANNSDNNRIIAVYTRALADTPAPVEGAWDRVKIMDGELDIVSVSGMPIANLSGAKLYSEEEYLDHLRPEKKKSFLNFRKKVESHYNTSYGRLCYSAFIKREKMMNLTPSGCTFDRPRLIQACSGIVKNNSAVWFYNYSNAMKACWNHRNWIYYCSGRTADEFNRWLEHHVERLGGESNTGVACSDYSKYDLTQGTQCMEREDKWYKSLGFCEDVLDGSMILRHKLHSTGFCGAIRYSVPGTRKSGDMDTSSGNTKNTGEAIGSFFKYHGLKEHVAIAVLGDDNFTLFSLKHVLAVFGSLKNLESCLRAWNADLGYSLKVKVTTNIASAEFLSSRFWPTVDGYRIGKKPGRVLTKIGYLLYRHNVTSEDYLKSYKGTLISYLPTANHVPFLRVYIRCLLEKLSDVTAHYNVDTIYRMNGSISEADSSTWAAFEALYGLDEADEKAFEAQLRSFLKSGMSGVIDSHYVDVLFRVDFLLD